MSLSAVQPVAAPGHSTGPRTPEGKLASSQNARKHGCCSKLVLQPGEDAAEWEALQASLIAEYQHLESPGAIPLAIRAAEARWAQIRAQMQFDNVQYEICAEQPDCCQWTEQHHKQYSRFQRYCTAADRAFHRAFMDLERLRTAYFKARKIAFKEEIDLANQSLRKRKNDLQAELVQAKIDLCNARNLRSQRPNAGTASTDTPSPRTLLPTSAQPSSFPGTP